ncbi:MAG: hypothetical protein QMD20_03690 [Candidatus Bathyarchaeia archaeon]|nr:hypothetical protein [Candidatus Bathyarchaeia archaeon]
MSRIKKAIDYINELRSSNNPKKQLLGKALAVQYAKWTKTLNLQDFLAFAKIIQDNKTEIGAAQFFGKFRAYAFEEYIYRLLQAKVRLSEPLQIFWGEKCLVWRKSEKEYAMEFDVAIGKKTNDFFEPKIVFDAKVELDSARLKTALASFAILKRWNAEVKCLLVYVIKDVDSAFMELASYWVDEFFHLSLEKDETRALLDYVSKCLMFAAQFPYDFYSFS